ncbi:MAG TPA: molybdopterin molybdotransferase MoeA [Kiritimatiellia bacterium]|nr:molybdopterin molybdotransferase MoeA [Kiritimatiellia bacterium]HMO97823.1 molybdopterin molybdotransferase MoeA [Kiritimatiellia bacterium]HMP96430.1 molybdopterin molybdotransferase MoeA [Kiritimatiellia bacterium]
MPLLTVIEAERLIQEATPPSPPTEMVVLTEALGRVLAEPVLADRDYPPINRATMDGIAVHRDAIARGTNPLTVECTIPAGVPAPRLRDPRNGCARIMTGAEVPENAEGIVPVEDVRVENGFARLVSPLAFTPGQHIHAKSIDRRRGDHLLEPGAFLDAPRIAILAAVGRSRIRVARAPRCAVISNGDEIVPIDREVIAPTEVRASNLIALCAGLTALGITEIDARHLPDDPGAITTAITEQLAVHDVLLLSGGVSKGAFDYIPSALAAAGARNVFHGVAQKPGKPLWFGKTDSCFVFGLPGNPVSTLSVFRRYVAPFIIRWMGGNPPLPRGIQLSGDIHPHPLLTLFIPVRVESAASGLDRAIPVEYHGSGDFAALSDSNGFIEMPPISREIVAKSRIFPFYSWHI